MTTIADTIKKAMSTHWVDTPYAHGPVEAMAWHLEKFFRENYGVYAEGLRLEEIEDEWVEYFKAFKRGEGCSNSTINKYLSCLSVLFDVAGVTKPTIKRLPEKRVEKWWMPPDQVEGLLAWLGADTTISREFDTLVALMCFNGLRVKEALALRWEHVDLDNDWLRVPGTKTLGAEAAIPLSPKARQYLALLHDYPLERHKGSIRVLNDMTYEQARDIWQRCRKEHLKVEHIPTATLKALRRTFAAYATQAGMPTATLQKVMRHESITTTQGYLRLTGDPALEEARKYMTTDRVLSIETHEGPHAPLKVTHMGPIREAIKAYTETGATPEEVAEFTKALLKG